MTPYYSKNCLLKKRIATYYMYIPPQLTYGNVMGWSS